MKDLLRNNQSGKQSPCSFHQWFWKFISKNKKKSISQVIYTYQGCFKYLYINGGGITLKNSFRKIKKFIQSSNLHARAPFTRWASNIHFEKLNNQSAQMINTLILRGGRGVENSFRKIKNYPLLYYQTFLERIFGTQDTTHPSPWASFTFEERRTNR